MKDSRLGKRSGGGGSVGVVTDETVGSDPEDDENYEFNGLHRNGDGAGDTPSSSTCATSPTTSWKCHSCTFLNKDAHRQDCSFCGATTRGDTSVDMMSKNEDVEKCMSNDNGSIYSNKESVDNSKPHNNLHHQCSTDASESQSSTKSEKRRSGSAHATAETRQPHKHRRPSGGSRLLLHPPNNNKSSHVKKCSVGGDDHDHYNENNDDDGTSSDDFLNNTSDVDSIRLIDSVSKASVASTRRVGRRGTVPSKDTTSSTLLQSETSSPRRHHLHDDDGDIRRRRKTFHGEGRQRHDHSESEHNIDQEERHIESNKHKTWAKGEEARKQLPPSLSTRSEDDDDDDEIEEEVDSKSSSGSGSITKSGINTAKTLCIPVGDVTIVYTDVQGSTSLWEADPYSMKKATDIHDSIIRKCYSEHGGYEISTEGDSFNLAFQHPADAIGFALRAQLLLHRARWPMALLHRPEMCENEKLKFRGFRVRMGMHHGPTTSRVHKTTGRSIYQGDAVNVAKALEKMCHGGQILTTVETWRSLSGMAEKFLGSPQVLDCGEHVLYDPKKIAKMNGSNSGGAGGDTSSSTRRNSKTKRVVSKRIVQLVPNSLSYDFFAARSWQEENQPPARVCGRVFPPLLSHGQLSTSFFNAPYIGNRVAMVFVYTHKMDKVTDRERKKNYKILAKYVRSHLMRLYPPGYECQEQKGSWMLAFDRIENGIKFGLDLKEDVIKNSKLHGNINKKDIFRIGIVWGSFLSMGPHTVSGHADYFGPIGKLLLSIYFCYNYFIHVNGSLFFF